MLLIYIHILYNVPLFLYHKHYTVYTLYKVETHKGKRLYFTGDDTKEQEENKEEKSNKIEEMSLRRL